MPTWDTPNSQHSYTVSDSAEAIVVEVRGGAGGDGGDGSSFWPSVGGTGGDGGIVSGEYPVSGGETLTISVGDEGGTGGDGVNGAAGSGGQSPIANGGDGGAGGTQGGGGGGGAPTAIELSDGSYLALGEGGGGGGGGTDNANDGSAGGGGARGGAAGDGPGSPQAGAGTGDGGAGADAIRNPSVARDGNPGQPGGTVTASGWTTVSTGTTTEAPLVSITEKKPPAAPSNLSIDAARETELDISWSDVGSETGYRISKSRDGGASWTEVADLPADTTSHTVTGLLTGEEYDIQVEAYNSVGSTASTTTATTVLPDADQPQLGNGVEDEIAVDRETAPTNDGDVRWQVRETGQSSWDGSATGFDEGTIAFDTLSFLITGREDGEGYEVRLRTETEHRIGAWTAPVSIVTKFPGATSLSFPTTDKTSVSLSWTDNADNEDGFRVDRRKEYADGFGPWRELADLAPNTESYTDDTVQPARTYEYRIEAYTEHTSAATTATVTTPEPAGVRQTRVPSRGWYVEVEHPDRTAPLTPRILDDPQIQQQVNGLPTLRIPVPRDDVWQRESFTDAPMRVWRDGRRQPVEELQAVDTQADRTVLEAVGGLELERGIQTQVDQQPVDEFVRQQVADITSLATNVDDPQATVSGDKVLQSTVFNSFAELIADALSETEPVGVVAGALQPLRSSWMATVGNEQLEGGYTTVSDFGSSAPNYIDGEAARLSGASASSTLQSDEGPSYTLPGDRVGVAYHNESLSGSGDLGDLLLELVVDGDRYTVDDVAGGSGWTTVENFGAPEIPPDATVSIEYTVASSFDVDCDALVLYDTKHKPDFPAVTSSLEPLDAPRPYQPITISSIQSTPALSVTGGVVVLDIDDTSGAQEIAVSNDGGTSFASASNTASFSHDFAALGASLEARLTLDGYGSRGVSPATGYLPQRVSSYELSADLEDTPLVLDQVYDQSLLSVLQDLADYSDSIFELQWDASAGELSLEWTRPGQRDPQSAQRISPDWSTSKSTAERPDIIRVEGSAVDREETISATVGSAVALSERNLVSGSEQVQAVSDDTVYERGKDYDINWLTGDVTALSSGSISDGESLAISYRQKPAYEASVGGSDGERKETIQLPGLVTERGVGVAARRIAGQLDTPLREATVTIPVDEDWSLVNSIDPEAVPTDGPLDVKSVETGTGDVVLTLGSRDTLGEIVSDIRTKLSKTAERS